MATPPQRHFIVLRTVHMVSFHEISNPTSPFKKKKKKNMVFISEGNYLTMWRQDSVFFCPRLLNLSSMFPAASLTFVNSMKPQGTSNSRVLNVSGSRLCFNFSSNSGYRTTR